MNKCFNCDKEVIWGGDHMYEDLGIDEPEGIASNYSCSNADCNTTYIVYKDLNE